MAREVNPLFQFSNERLKERARGASVLNVVGRSIELVLQLLTLIVLARLLSPADFGVFAMVTPFVWVIILFGDLGLAAVVLQQRDLTQGRAAALFRANVLAGLGFGAAFLACSPFLGLLYGDDQATQIAAALSLTFVISAFTAVPVALLRRALLFKVLLRAQIVAACVASAVAVALACAGSGYWALVGRALTEPLTYGVVLWISSGWVPSRPEWDATTKSLLRFGRYMVGFNTLTEIARQADNVLIGWRFGSAELGPYALAYRFFLIPVLQLCWPLGHVMIPVLSRLRDEPERLRWWYSNLLRLVTLAAFPPLISLVICAEDVVRVVAGPQWTKAAEILRLLGPVSGLQVAYSTCDWLMQAHGRFDRAFRWAAVSATTHLACFVVGLAWGAIGVAAGLATANVLLFIPGFMYALRGTPISLVDALVAMLPSFVVAALSVAAAWSVQVLVAAEWQPFSRLLLTGVAIGAIMAFGATLLYGRRLLKPVT